MNLLSRLACVAALLASLLLPGLASAHPGHGTTDPASPAHYLLEPLHLAPLVLAISACLLALTGYRQREQRR